MDLRVPIIFLLMATHLLWATKDTLDGLTICIRMKIRDFPDHEKIVTLDSRDIYFSVSK